MKRIYILEGADGCGKSVLATALARQYHAILTRHGPYPGDGDRVWLRYLAAMLPAYAGIASVVMDRSWLSEPIYGDAYRGGANRISTAQRRMLERVALGRGAAVVLCRIPWTRCAENFRRRKAEGGEMLDDTAQLKKVYDGYKRLQFAKAYDGWNTPPLRMVPHNFTDAGVTINRVMSDLNHGSDAEVNPGPGIGAWREERSVLLVGERPGGWGGRWHLPFVSPNAGGCSAWLADRLEEAGIPESALYWVNAVDGPEAHGDELRGEFIAQLRPRAIFALGERAANWLSARVNLKSGMPPVIVVDHPQHHKRFHHSKPYPLLKEIQRVLS